jgi:protein phosphatase PTC1
MISVTRALGDHHMKQWLVNEPYFYATELQDTDSTLILACDGLWDVMEPQAALDFIKDEEDAQLAAKKLLVKAIQDGSTDNLTVMVVRL